MKNSIALIFLLLFPTFLFAQIEVESIEYEKGFLGFNQDSKFPFNVRKSSRCMFGDFDAVKQDMQYSKTKTLLASLSTLDGKFESTAEIFEELSKPLKVKSSVELSEKMKDYDRMFKKLELFGDDFDLEAPSIGGGEVLLLSVCKDSSGQKSCLNKPVKDVNEILKIYQQPPSDYSPPDHVYFRQLVVASDGILYFFKKVVDDKSLAGIKDFVSSKGVGDPELLDAELNNLKTLKSVPLRKHNNRIQIDLPAFDKARCGQ